MKNIYGEPQEIAPEVVGHTSRRLREDTPMASGDNILAKHPDDVPENGLKSPK